MAMFKTEVVCFGFRIIDMEDGSQVIDESMKTPMDSLTPEMQADYMEVHEQLAFMERMRKKERREMDRLKMEPAPVENRNFLLVLIVYGGKGCYNINIR